MKKQEEVRVGEMRPMLNAAMDFAADDRRVLLLAGRVGCGKTHAAEVAAELHPEEGRLVTAFRLSRLAPWDKEIDVLIRIRGVLVIDDVGTEHEAKAGKFASLLDGIVNDRHHAGRKTVLTTNLNVIQKENSIPGQSFRERYGERLFDRIRGNGRAMESNSESLRGKKLGSVTVWRYAFGPGRAEFEETRERQACDRDRGKVLEMSEAFVSRLAGPKRYGIETQNIDDARKRIQRQLEELREKQG